MESPDVSYAVITKPKGIRTGYQLAIQYSVFTSEPMLPKH